MKFYIFFLLLLVLLSGCAKGVDNSNLTEADYRCDGSFYTADGDFTDSEKVQIASAVQRLNEWLGFEVTKVGDVGKCMMAAEAIPDKPDSGPNFVIGYWDGYQVVLDTEKMHAKYDKIKKFDDVFQVAVMHELLHSLGMDHHEGPGIMNPVVGFEFTEEDREQCIADKVCK